MSTAYERLLEYTTKLKSNIDKLLGKKVDKEDGKGLSTNDYTTEEKNKLAGIADGANNYTHPENHPATMITEDETHRFVTDTEKSTWNNKANKTLVSTDADGLMSALDKTKLDGIDLSVKVDKTTTVNNKPLSENITLTAADVGAVDVISKGAANGVASLDESGKIPSAQLPSYVDDVIEVENYEALPPTGESGKIYIDKASNKTYRWGGSSYVDIPSSIALGETASTAYPGDKGKAVTDEVNKIKDGTTVVPKAGDSATVTGFTVGVNVPADAKFTDTVYTHPDNHPATMITEDTDHKFVSDTEKAAWNSKADNTVATTEANGLMSKEDKTKLDGIEEPTALDTETIQEIWNRVHSA